MRLAVRWLRPLVRNAPDSGALQGRFSSLFMNRSASLDEPYTYPCPYTHSARTGFPTSETTCWQVSWWRSPLIPEAIAFSIIAGVDPKVGLYASFCVFHPNSATHNDRNPPPVTTPSRPPIPPAKPPPIPIKKPARSAGSEFRYKNRRSCAERCAPSPQPAHRLPLEFHPMRSAH